MRVVLLVGLPGSGKSTLSKQEFSNYAYINQDSLGSKDNCVFLYKECLSKNMNIIVDRCNQDKKQRKLWINIALQYGVESVNCIYLDVNEEECIARILSRKNHETILENFPISKKRSIVYKMNKELELPTLDEGFSSILFMRN